MNLTVLGTYGLGKLGSFVGRSHGLITHPVTSANPIPYIGGIIIFILTYLLITNPVYTILVTLSESDLYAKYTIALLLAAVVFIITAYAAKPSDVDPIPQ